MVGIKSFLSNINLRFLLVLGISYYAFAGVFCYVIPTFQSFGYNTLEIGIFVTCLNLMSMACNPLWGRLSDKLGSPKRIFMVLSVLGGGALIALRAAGPNFPLTVAACLLMSMTVYCSYYLIDAWAVQQNALDRDLHYGLIRGGAALFYAVGAFSIGYIFETIPVIYIIAIVAAMLIALTIPDRRPGMIAVAAEPEAEAAPAQADSHRAAEPSPRVIELFKNPRYVFLLASVFLLVFGTNPLTVLFPVRITELGGTTADYGLAQALLAFAEVPTLLFFNRIFRRPRYSALFLVAVFFMVMKNLAYALAWNVPTAIAAPALQVAGYGLYLCALAGYLPQIVDKRLLVTAQTIIVAVGWSMAAVTGNPVAGNISLHIGVQNTMLLLTAISSLGFILLALSMLPDFTRDRKRRNRVDLYQE